MEAALTSILEHLHDPRPGLHPIPGTTSLTVSAALAPPVMYYAALLLLAPFASATRASKTIATLRNLLAVTAAVLFFRLPLAYHVSQSIGLTYQLGLVGLYGGCRVVDAFFISPSLFDHIPRRVRYEFSRRKETHKNLSPSEKEWTSGGVKDPFLVPDIPSGHVPTTSKAYDSTAMSENPPVALDEDTSALQQANALLTKIISGPEPLPVYESAHTEEGWPSSWSDRASWALELELSMRGTGWTWTTADVRHTRKTWLPTVHNRLHSIFFHTMPVLLVCWGIIKTIYVRRFQEFEDLPWSERPTDLLDTELPAHEQLILTAALGSFLLAAFALGHSMFAIMLHPLSPSPLAFFPPLYTLRFWEITSVRKFWSYGWHRLFARLFLVYGVWPGEWLQRKISGQSKDTPADIGKVLGAFASSAFVHAFSVRCVLGGDWRLAAGEARFFALNGVAVVLEGAIVIGVKSFRKKMGWPEKELYDAWIVRLWWISVLLWTGRNFARGWITAELVREMAFM
jgi:hypothetical protein